jgi:rRNA maturation RNase YbeY
MRGQSWRDELLLYIIHGCLHLCGYDDIRKADARKMAVEQERILKLVTTD